MDIHVASSISEYFHTGCHIISTIPDNTEVTCCNARCYKGPLNGTYLIGGSVAAPVNAVS